MVEDSRKPTLIGVLTEAISIVAGGPEEGPLSDAEKRVKEALEEGVEAVEVMTGKVGELAASVGDALYSARDRMSDLIGRFHDRPLNKGNVFFEPEEIVASSANKFGDDDLAFEINIEDWATSTGESHPHHVGMCSVIADCLIAGDPGRVSDDVKRQKEFIKYLSGIKGRGRNSNVVG